MRSLYISHGSEFADLEAIESFCSHNDCSKLVVLLFTDASGAKEHLKNCFKGIEVIICKCLSNEAAGIYDSTRCNREFAFQKVREFSSYMIDLMLKITSKNRAMQSREEALADIRKVFVFNETVRVTCNVDQWTDSLHESHTVAYTVSSEVTMQDTSVTRVPSLLSGSILCMEGGALRAINTELDDVVKELPCMRGCSCLLDLMLHNALTRLRKTAMSNIVRTKELSTTEAAASYTTTAGWQSAETGEISGKNPRIVSFVDMSIAFECSRVVTAPYRFIPEKNQHLFRHAVRDEHCKVGIVASDVEHAVLLDPVVRKLSKRVAEEVPSKAGIKYKVYVVDRMGKHRVQTFNKVKVTFSTMERVASKCKHVVFLSKECLPMRDFFADPQWMKQSCECMRSDSGGRTFNEHQVTKNMTSFMNRLTSLDDTSPINHPEVPYCLYDALEEKRGAEDRAEVTHRSARKATPRNALAYMVPVAGDSGSGERFAILERDAHKHDHRSRSLSASTPSTEGGEETRVVHTYDVPFESSPSDVIREDTNGTYSLLYDDSSEREAGGIKGDNGDGVKAHFKRNSWE